MKLIVGLGNVGSTYAATRHNVGFMVIDALARQHRVALTQRLAVKRRVVACFGNGRINGETVRLMLPQTMMNGSGESLADSPLWGIGPEELLVVCDDVNLPLGALRMKPQGGAGGHKGLASCLEAMQTERITRLRIGVGTAPLPADLTEFVLSTFRPAERPVIRQAIAEAVEACERWVTDGIQATMNRINPMTQE